MEQEKKIANTKIEATLKKEKIEPKIDLKEASKIKDAAKDLKKKGTIAGCCH